MLRYRAGDNTYLTLYKLACLITELNVMVETSEEATIDES